MVHGSRGPEDQHQRDRSSRDPVYTSRRLSTMSHTVPPILSVHPIRALVDEKFKVVVENLPPGSPVTLHSLHQSEDKDYWEAYGHYVSDHRGTVSVAEDFSFGGTYTGKEPMGLLWSMRPVPGSRKGLRLRKMNVCSPLLINISAYSGHVTEGFREQPPLASSLTERWYMAPGVQRINIREGEVRGTLFIPQGPGPFPGLLDMWGGSGGLVEYRSALLASRGYVTLAVEYTQTSEQMSGEIEFYLETAFNIIRDHPQVMPDRVGMFGLSLGSVMAIYLAAESGDIKPRCCVCVSGHHLCPHGVTLRELFQLLVTSNSHKERLDENNHQIWRDTFLPITSDPSLKVDVGKINCPVLVVNGLDDQNVAVVDCTDDMARMMRAAGNEHLLTRVEYPGAGHLIEPPYSPHFRVTSFIKPNTREKVTLVWGGQTKPHSDAQEDSWKKILAFLKQHLYSRPTLKAKM